MPYMVDNLLNESFLFIFIISLFISEALSSICNILLHVCLIDIFVKNPASAAMLLFANSIISFAFNSFKYGISIKSLALIGFISKAVGYFDNNFNTQSFIP